MQGCLRARNSFIGKLDEAKYGIYLFWQGLWINLLIQYYNKNIKKYLPGFLCGFESRQKQGMSFSVIMLSVITLLFGLESYARLWLVNF